MILQRDIVYGTGAGPKATGRFFAYDGAEVPW